MKKKIVILSAFLLFFLGSKTAFATSTCSYEDQAKLIKIAGQVKATYEEATGVKDPSTYSVPESFIGREDEYVSYYNYFKITVSNIAPETYVKVTNDYNDEIKYIQYSDATDGSYIFDWKDIYQVVNFTLTVYSSAKTTCPDEEFAITYMTSPMYNEYANTMLCDEVTDQYYLCQKYITTAITYDMFEKQVTDHLESLKNEETETKKNKKWYEKTIDFVKKNKNYFIIGGSVIIVGGVVTTVVVIKKRKREII